MPRDPRPISCDSAERAIVLGSLSRVGPTKAIGYLPLYTIIDVLKLAPEILAKQARAKGLTAIQLGPEQCCIESGALYVYDRETLVGILQNAADALVRLGMPLDPDQFIRHIAANWFDRTHPAYAIIAAAFGDQH